MAPDGMESTGLISKAAKFLGVLFALQQKNKKLKIANELKAFY